MRVRRPVGPRQNGFAASRACCRLVICVSSVGEPDWLELYRRVAAPSGTPYLPRRVRLPTARSRGAARDVEHPFTRIQFGCPQQISGYRRGDPWHEVALVVLGCGSSEMSV